jgi:toxin-antitoxin system PIN domain toxin
LSGPKFLLDVNVLIALTQPEHPSYARATEWFGTPGLDWGLCDFCEAGFLRLSSHPSVGKLTVRDAMEVLAELTKVPGFRYWTTTERWAELAWPFVERVVGHQQVTDAFLLGLAIKENGVLVTLDKGIQFLAGARFAKHVLVLGTAA